MMDKRCDDNAEINQNTAASFTEILDLDLFNPGFSPSWRTSHNKASLHNQMTQKKHFSEVRAVVLLELDGRADE